VVVLLVPVAARDTGAMREAVCRRRPLQAGGVLLWQGQWEVNWKEVGSYICANVFREEL
jgi:hypothetical protein